MNCINSMRHGYIETERFPEICAKLLRSEFNSSFPTTDQQSLSWLKLVFVENHFDTLRTRRALKDMITLCIYNHLGGISGQETINDANTMDNSQIDFSDPFIQQLFNVYVVLVRWPIRPWQAFNMEMSIWSGVTYFLRTSTCSMPPTLHFLLWSFMRSNCSSTSITTSSLLNSKRMNSSPLIKGILFAPLLMD